MNKDIYRLMNNVNIDENKYEDSVLTQEEKDKIFRMVTNKKGSEKNMKKSVIMKVIAGAAATAAAFAFVTGNINIPGKGDSNIISVENGDVSVSKNSFVLRASAASIEDYSFNNSDIAIVYSGHSIDNFFGMDFEISGENISEVSVSVSNGSLCKVIKTKTSDLPLDIDNMEKYVHMISSSSNDDNREAWINYEMIYSGNEITEQYDGTNKYGFCLSGERYEEIFNSFGEGQDKNAYYACVDEFDGQTLTVAVKYTDGTEETKNYTLKSGRLKVDTSADYILNEESEMKVLPEFTDGEGTPWMYGIVASLA